MFIAEICTDDVNRWIEEDAKTALDLFEENGGDLDNAYRYVYTATENTLTYTYNMLAIIAWSGYLSDAFTGAIACYEDSPAAIYERAVYSRLMELVEEEAED